MLSKVYGMNASELMISVVSELRVSVEEVLVYLEVLSTLKIYSRVLLQNYVEAPSVRELSTF